MGGKRPRMCVAFLSPKWMNELFESSTPENLKVICDLQMQMTPRGALIAGGAPNNKRLRYLPDCEMHSKLYLSEKGAIICSANASKGALSSKTRIEDGIWVGPNTEAYSDVENEFKKRYKRADQIDTRVLKSVPEHVPGAGTKPKLPPKPTLAEILRCDPSAFKGIRFVCSDSIVDEDIRKAADKRFEQENDDTIELERKELRGYFSDWGRKKNDWPSLFFSIYRGPDGGIDLSKNCRPLLFRSVEAQSGMKREDVFVTHQLDWRTSGASFGDVPRLASKDKCLQELKGLFSSKVFYEKFAGEILTGEKFAEMLL